MSQNLFAGRVEPIQLEDEMQRSYLDYAMSVIVSRAQIGRASCRERVYVLV